MDTLFDEAEADATVRKHLNKYKKGKRMPLFKDGDTIHQVTDSEEVTREELEGALKDAKEVYLAASADLKEYDSLVSAPTQESTEDTPVEQPVPEPQVQEPPVETPAPAPQEPTPEAEQQPADPEPKPIVIQ